MTRLSIFHSGPRVLGAGYELHALPGHKKSWVDNANVQEADGTPAYLGNYTSFVPYGGAGLSGVCNTNSMGGDFTSSTVYTLLRPPNKPGGLPIINAACAVVTSYLRTQPTRI